MTEAFLCVLTLPLYALNCNTMYVVDKGPKEEKTEILATYKAEASTNALDISFAALDISSISKKYQDAKPYKNLEPLPQQ